MITAYLASGVLLRQSVGVGLSVQSLFSFERFSGNERFYQNKRIQSSEICARQCCESTNCRTWQYNRDRGCYYNEDKADNDFYCDPYKGMTSHDSVTLDESILRLLQVSTSEEGKI
jgi:hypothetical protein